MKKLCNRLISLLLLANTMGFVSTSVSQELDPNVNYVIKGAAVPPWELSLQFGKVPFVDGKAKTAKGALTASPATRDSENDAIHLKWIPRDVKDEWGGQNKNVSYVTVMNKSANVDLSSVKDQAALVFDVKVIKAPNKLVELTMECKWDWKCRSTVPLRGALKKLPKKKWISVPIPLQCFDDGNFDFSKISNIFMLYTKGKMEIELGDVRLSAFPADKVKCGGRK